LNILPSSPPPQYRFADFVLSPRRRVLLRDGIEQPLIPRYLDLLLFLIAHRHEAVHRRDIFDQVWRDVIVSDSALSQAVRTIRRTLGDDPREPRFIRTVSRHGYRFVFIDVVEEPDGHALLAAATTEMPAVIPSTGSDAHPSTLAEDLDPFEPLLERLSARPADLADEEEQREAAELLHGLGTAEALARLDRRPGHPRARALLRDTRWEAAGAGAVPLLGAPAPLASAAALVGLRLRRAARIAGLRWAAASLGGGVAGACAGASGGLVLAAAPGSSAPIALAAVLGLVGGACGAAGGAGVGAGLAAAEAVSRSRRALALVCGAAAGGGISGALVQWMGGWSLATLVGVRAPVGGALEGVAIGAATGLAYALAAPHVDTGLAVVRGARRLRAVALIAGAGCLAALALTAAGRPLVGATIHAIAQASEGAQATLTPFARLLGEPEFGPLTRAFIAAAEGTLFGIGLGLGLTRRP
jgi:DNA-binding winged helix-turn-helix (wHTH) protein